MNVIREVSGLPAAVHQMASALALAVIAALLILAAVAVFGARPKASLDHPQPSAAAQTPPRAPGLG